MLGWWVAVSEGDGKKAIAHWQVGLGGIDWLHDLASDGIATEISTGGYPTSFLVPAKNILPFLRVRQLPKYSGQFVIGDDYIDPGGVTSSININDQLLSEVDEAAMLVVEAWDES